MVRGECVVSCECRVYEVCFLMILRHGSLLRDFPDFTIDINQISLILIRIFITFFIVSGYFRISKHLTCSHVWIFLFLVIFG